jgi:hypothetical protein
MSVFLITGIIFNLNQPSGQKPKPDRSCFSEIRLAKMFGQEIEGKVIDGQIGGLSF